MSVSSSPSRIAIVVTILLLATFGVCYIFSTGYLGTAYPIRPNWLRQCAFLAFGMLAAWGMGSLDNRGAFWRTVVWCGYGFSLVLLVVVLIAGRQIGGARRWLSLGPLLLQPAEFAKIFTVLAGSLVLSGDLCQTRRKELVIALLCFAAPIALILLEPSYGNAGALVPCLAVLLGVRILPKWLWTIAVLAATAFLIAAAFGLTYLRNHPPQNIATTQQVQPEMHNPVIHSFLHGYHLKRLRAFLSPDGDWNEQQSLMTVAGGGIFGKGYLNGTMKKLGFLPRTVAPTDFIFAVIAEEGGLVFGTLPVLTLYALLLGLLLHRASHAASQLDLNLLTTGTMLLFVHILVGIGMPIRLLPVIGLPLPLLSYGGSFTVAVLLLLGNLLGANQATTEEEAGSHIPDADQPSFSARLGALFQVKFRMKND